MEQKLNKQSIDAMLSPSEFGSGTLYDVIINNGLAAFQSAAMFDYACRKSVEIYIHYNDGVHSNNIMQMYKMIMGKSLYGWFHLCAIRIYGRRTPGYFFEHPEKLWQKVALCLEFPESADEPSKRVSRDRAAGAVADLLRFYIRAFEDPQYASLKPKAETFNKYYIENHVQSRLQLPPDLGNKIMDLALYAAGKKKQSELPQELTPATYFAERTRQDIARQEEASRKGQIYTASTEKHIIKGNGELIYVIGAMDSDARRIEQIAKNNGYNINIVSDYAKLTNNDINALRYNPKYAGVIVGPMPHSVKGMGEHSSGITCMEQESGFPPVVRATASTGKPKLTKTSFTAALAELSHIIWETQQSDRVFG